MSVHCGFYLSRVFACLLKPIPMRLDDFFVKLNNETSQTSEATLIFYLGIKYSTRELIYNANYSTLCTISNLIYRLCNSLIICLFHSFWSILYKSLQSRHCMRCITVRCFNGCSKRARRRRGYTGDQHLRSVRSEHLEQCHVSRSRTLPGVIHSAGGWITPGKRQFQRRKCVRLVLRSLGAPFNK